MRFILILTLFLNLTTKAVQDPPVLVRACLNFDTDIVTLTWRPPLDLCGSFTKYSIYASFDFGPFTKLDDINNISIKEYPHALTQADKKWRYYITVHTLCDGLDSARSNEIAINDANRSVVELDSLSYDLQSQDIIAGWKPNPSPDGKSYKLFDFTSNADSIGETNNTFANITRFRSGSFPVVLSTVDSCNLTAEHSKPHRAVTLNGTIDTCDRSITLRWNQYIGWDQIDSQVLFISINGSPFIPDTTFTSGTNSFIYKNLNLGDTLEYYLRSYTQNGEITSSSSKIKFSTRKLINPSHLYLSWVTVNDNFPIQSSTSLSWNTDSLQDIRSFNVCRSLNNQPYSLFRNIPSSTENEYELSDFSSDPDNQIYQYKIEAINKCADTVATSNQSKNILLNITSTSQHNNYEDWERGVSEYTLQYSTDRFTWNTIEVSSNPINNTETTKTGCYRIIANELLNSLNYSSRSYSNVKCVFDSLEYYITTAINPLSNNNKFIVKGRGIDLIKSNYEIYNRWGELIVKRNIQEPWETDYQNQPVQAGLYIYIVNMFGVLGEQEVETGTVNVIR